MSGTPLRNRPIELWPVLNMLRPDRYASYVKFGTKYCKAEVIRGKLEFRGAQNLDTLHRNLTRLCMFRRLKKDVLKDLPEYTRQIIPLPYEHKAEYKKAEKQFLSWVGQTYGKGAMLKAKKSQSLSKTGYLRRLIIKNKMKYVIDWIDDFLHESDEKLVLLGCHTEPIEQLCKRYAKVHVRVDGTVTSMKKRKLAVDKFQNDPNCRLFIGNIEAAGEGLTLTAASHLAFFEIDWVPARHAQGEARIHRISQDNHCFIYYLVAQGTVEERIVSVVEEKSGNLNQILDGGEGESIELLEQLAQSQKTLFR